MKESQATENARRALGAELAAYRDAAGFSQARLAALIAYSRSTIANVETGRQRVPRQFWEHADTALRTGGVFASGHDELEESARRDRQAAAHTASAARLRRSTQSPDRDLALGTGSEITGELNQLAGDLSAADMTWPADSGSSRSCRPGDLIRLQGMRRQLKDIDNSYGGGTALPMAMTYLRHEIPLLLNGLSGRTSDRTLIDVVALFRLDIGWMAYDAAQQQIATQHYCGARRLARSSGNGLLTARVLAAMSHQAIYLGQIRQAVDYAQAARSATRHITTPRTTAMLAAMQACAFAAAGNASDCHHALAEAADAVALIRAEPEPESLDFDEGGYWGHAARAYRDLGQLHQAETCAQKSVRMCLPAHSRTRAQRYAIHAAAHLHLGELEAAAAAGQHMIREAWNLHSSHVLGEITQLARQIAPSQAAGTADFLDQARELLAARTPTAARVG